MYKVYIKTDGEGNVTFINSDSFTADVSGLIKIDEGEGDRFHHAQGNYLGDTLLTETGGHRYRYEDGNIVLN